VREKNSHYIYIYAAKHSVCTFHLRSEERTFIQHLCGWNTNFSDLVESSATRRAAISLFHLKLRPAIKILTESGNSIVAMAIAGFTDDRNSLWREQAQTNCAHLTDPYIRAIFSFLTETDSNFDSILVRILLLLLQMNNL